MMTNREPSSTLDELESMNWLYYVAFTVGIGVILFIWFFGPLKDLVSGIDILRNSTALGLGIATTFVLVMWIMSPKRNLNIIKDWLQYDTVQRNTQYEYLFAFGIVLTYGGLFYFLNQPVIYSIVFVIYCSIYWFSIRYFHRWVDSAINVAEDELSTRTKQGDSDIGDQEKIQQDALDILRHYHLQRPHLSRIGIMGLFGLVAFVIAIIGKLGNIIYLEIISSILLGIVLIISEFFIIHWRNVRDKGLLEARIEMKRLSKRIDILGNNTNN